MISTNRSHILVSAVIAVVGGLMLLFGVSGEAGEAWERSAGGRQWETRQTRVAAVIGEVLSGTEIEENLRILCDEIGGRVSGTEGGKQARDFAERLFNRYGLSNVHQEPFEMFRMGTGPVFLRVHRSVQESTACSIPG